MGLDAVEIIIAIEETFGIDIPDSVFSTATTPAILIAYVQNAVGSQRDHSSCISQRAFHRVRASLMKITGVGRSEITLKTPINRLFTGSQRSELWKNFKIHAGLPDLPNLGFGFGWLLRPTSVNHLVSRMVLAISSEIREERSWTNEEVRQIIRSIISNQISIRDFKDTDEFVRDLGLD
jgi:acyl carrier protein